MTASRLRATSALIATVCLALVLPSGAGAATTSTKAPAVAAVSPERLKLAALYTFMRATTAMPSAAAIPGGLLACDLGGDVTVVDTDATFTDCVNSLDPSSRWSGTMSSAGFSLPLADTTFRDITLTIGGLRPTPVTFSNQLLTVIHSFEGAVFNGGSFSPTALNFTVGSGTSYRADIFSLGFPTLMTRSLTSTGAARTKVTSLNAILTVNQTNTFVADIEDTLPVVWTDGDFPTSGMVSFGELDGTGIYAVRFSAGGRFTIINTSTGSTESDRWTSPAMRAALLAVTR